MKGRFKCDPCGYEPEDKVELSEALIDTPCPKCGANMLTREQYDLTLATGEGIRALFEALGVKLGDEPVPGGAVIRVNAVKRTVEIKEHKT